MKKILLGYNLPKEWFNDLVNAGYEIKFPSEDRAGREEILKEIADYDVLIPNFTFKIDEEIMLAGKKLKLIANYAVGYDNIDIKAASKLNIAVSNIPNAVLEPTAELCFALMLAASRKLGYFTTQLYNKNRVGWGTFDDLSHTLYGNTLGIYGMGRIGQAVARRAVASGMKIIYHNRNRLSRDIELLYNASYVDFDTLLKSSDVLTLNAPATKETYHLIGENELKKMKNTATLINTARGSLIDEQALANALKNNTIYAAGLDVFENEPKINPDLLGLDNIILTPHAGTATLATRLEMQKELAQNIINFFEGKSFARVN